MAEDVHTLVASSNAGRFALDWAEGQDLTSGTQIAIDLGGRWIAGRVEHSRVYIVSPDAVNGGIERGYYFVALNGGICGLCVGMKVKVL